jgi:tetratricopeptide (TPR) repeat protein
MEAHFELVRRQIEHHSGQEVKTMGDGFMVAFTSARGAVNCAVALQKTLADHNLNNPDEQVHVRIGLNTGEAIEKEGDLFGTAVDAASRIMSKAAGGQVLLSEHTCGVIGTGEDLALIDRGPFWLKGFPDRWRLYEVLWREEKASAFPAPPRMAERTPFVGRENERADLRRFLERAKGGHGSLVMIGGEPGVGKTRITEELVAEARRHGFLTLTGHCYEMEGAPPYLPFVEIIESTVHIVTPEALLTTMGDSAPELAKLMPELRRQFPGIPTPPQLPPEQERRRMFNGILDFITQAAHAQPLLLVLEDLHWADESTMLLLQHIALQLEKIPVLIGGTYRDTELDVARSLAKALEELLRRRLAHDLILRRLPETDVAAMLKGHADKEPPARLIELVYRETEGIPFFVEEVFKHLAEEGKLFDTKGDWLSDIEIDEAEVPRGVRLVIGRRLERVSEECRRTLTAASIIGRGFSFDLLEELANLDEDSLYDSIEAAEQAQLISSKRERGKVRFVFSHELIRQTLFSGLSLPRRQKAHLRVAETIERLHSDALEEHAADLAYHFYQGGGDPQKIIEFSVLAAERAVAQTAYGEAAEQYRRALQTLEEQHPIDELRQCKLLLALGKAFGNAGDSDNAQQVLMRGVEIARKLPAPEQFAEAVLGFHRFKYLTGFSDHQYVALMEEGLALLGEEDSALRAALLGQLSNFFEHLGDERKFSYSEQAEAMARRVGDQRALYYALWSRTFVWDRPLEVKMAAGMEFAQLEQEIGAQAGVNWALVYLCHFHWEQGDMDAVFADMDALRKVAEELSIPDATSRIKFTESTYAQMVGRFDEAESLASEGFEIGRKVHKVASGQMFTGLMYPIRWLQGRSDEVDEAWQRMAKRHPEFFTNPITAAHLHLMLGRDKQARKDFENIAARDFADLRRDFMLPHNLILLSELAAGLGDTRRAALIYDISSPYADYLGMMGIGNGTYGSLAHWLGMLAATMKRWDDAVAHFESAIETNARVGARPFLARSQHEYARMLIERGESGDKEKAKELLTEATAIYRELGMPTFLENAEELLNGLQ